MWRDDWTVLCASWCIDDVTAICEFGIQQESFANRISKMAEHKHGEMDISVQEKTFDGFINFTKWSVIVILAILVFMAIFTS